MCHFKVQRLGMCLALATVATVATVGLNAWARRQKGNAPSKPSATPTKAEQKQQRAMAQLLDGIMEPCPGDMLSSATAQVGRTCLEAAFEIPVLGYLIKQHIQGQQGSLTISSAMRHDNNTLLLKPAQSDADDITAIADVALSADAAAADINGASNMARSADGDAGDNTATADMAQPADGDNHESSTTPDMVLPAAPTPVTLEEVAQQPEEEEKVRHQTSRPSTPFQEVPPDLDRPEGTPAVSSAQLTTCVTATASSTNTNAHIDDITTALTSSAASCITSSSSSSSSCGPLLTSSWGSSSMPSSAVVSAGTSTTASQELQMAVDTTTTSSTSTLALTPQDNTPQGDQQEDNTNTTPATITITPSDTTRPTPADQQQLPQLPLLTSKTKGEVNRAGAAALKAGAASLKGKVTGDMQALVADLNAGKMNLPHLRALLVRREVLKLDSSTAGLEGLSEEGQALAGSCLESWEAFYPFKLGECPGQRARAERHWAAELKAKSPAKTPASPAVNQGQRGKAPLDQARVAAKLKTARLSGAGSCN